VIAIGSRPRSGPSGLVELLLDCHARIRTFVDLAERIAVTPALPKTDIREAAHAVRRYFTEALPLHVADEERTVLPRLVGLDPSLDAALELMRREHRAHGPHVSALIAICLELEAEPGRHAALRAPLMSTTTLLRCDFDSHLETEETLIFPAITQWLVDQQETMLTELRGRRSSAFRSSSE
jgi:iron-sulfur cluster repair protein YtfE (RIC family)